jgi:Tfp pilus assembly PilM family ATPase
MSTSSRSPTPTNCSGPGQPTIPRAKTATALIDVGASKSNIAIIQGTRLLFTREVYLAGNEITDAIVRTFNEPAENVERIKSAPGEALEALIDAAMPAFEDLANEIRLSFDYVEGQFEAQVNQVVLTGGSSQLPGIAEILGNILGRPVHVLDPSPEWTWCPAATMSMASTPMDRRSPSPWAWPPTC